MNKYSILQNIAFNKKPQVYEEIFLNKKFFK